MASEKTRKILITGGAGFIGSNFVRYWLAQHQADTVVVLDALTYAGNMENLAGLEKSFQFVHGDIRDRATVKKAMAGANVVVHFAAESHVDRSIANPTEFITTNVVGTQVLLDAAREVGVERFHHISTDEVFGHIPLESAEKFNEHTPYNPRSPYAASKAASDHLVRAYHITYGLPVTISNCSNNFGPYHFPEKLIPLAITNVLEGKKIPIYKPGNQVRDWLHVQDHCRAIEAILLRGRVGQQYVIGANHKEYTNLEVAKLIATLLGKDESVIEMVGDRPGHDVKYAIDFSKIQNELGWQPQHEFEEWLALTVQWYRDNEVWWKKLVQ